MTIPTPNPMIFSSPPDAVNATSITMTAFAAVGPGATEYFFTNIAGGGNDSGWQLSRVYVDTGLQPVTTYIYTVMARDADINQDVTFPSPPSPATTLDFSTQELIDAALVPVNLRIDASEADIATLQTDFATLQADTVVLDSNINLLLSILISLIGALNALTVTINTALDNLITLNTELIKATDELGGLNTTYRSAMNILEKVISLDTKSRVLPRLPR